MTTIVPLAVPLTARTRTLRLVVPQLAEEITREIIGMPGSQRPEHGHDRLRRTVERRLLLALDRLAEPSSGSAEEAELYRSLGHREYHAGHGPERLHAIYQAAARIAWRRFVITAADSGWPPTVTADLGECLLGQLGAVTDRSLRGPGGVGVGLGGQA